MIDERKNGVNKGKVLIAFKPSSSTATASFSVPEQPLFSYAATTTIAISEMLTRGRLG